MINRRLFDRASCFPQDASTRNETLRRPGDEFSIPASCKGEHESGLIETKESDLGFQFLREYATILHAHRYHI
jgi:hypothetical protein